MVSLIDEYLSPINKARWYKLIDHPTQKALIEDKARFKVVPAGRRSGKTERAKRFIIKEALRNPNEQYFVAAPTRDQVKKIYWNDLKKLMPESQKAKQPSETELTLHFKNGTIIVLIGLDKPERIEGTFWSGGIIDEIADIKPEAWEAHIRPALDTFNPTRPDYLAWCWLIGVPDGLNHYYDMYQYCITANDPDWKAYTWKSADILPAKTIEAAKRQMSKKQYLQEYEACHLPDTEVLLFNGDIKKIVDLEKGDELVHINEQGKKEKCKVLNNGKTLQKAIFTVTLETGLELSSSSNHCYKV